ncbi:MAG: sugar-transfer associated ATP-grasp domain-containing protein [Thermoplasmatota archaeon]
MRAREFFLHISVSVLLLAIVIWARLNMDHFQPILEGSQLFFQLIVAGTVIAVLRNVVGIRTFGVFGPAIVALGLVQPGLVYGLALYMDIFLVALVVSLLLHRVNMSSSHRMAIVITASAIAITVLELIGETFHLSLLELSIFFPVLITSWLADRFVMQVMEIDWIEPSKKLLGTVIVITVSFIVMSFDPLIRFVTLNPETWAGIIIVNVLIARFVNVRVMEYLRFKPAWWRNGKPKDIMGLNRRNREYVGKHNPRNLFPHIRKDRLKRTLHQLEVPTPETYCIISTKKEIACAEKVMNERRSFVIKPSSGYGGEGILVVDKDAGGNFSSKGRAWSTGQIKNHMVKILDGQYSTDWSDVALIEQKVVTSDILTGYYSSGVPDIRVIVFEGFPVMSMMRLPTLESGGSANMHKGAIGMGLRIKDGGGINPFWKGHGGSIEKHPDTGKDLKTLRIPNWSDLLLVAAKAQAASRLGYVGVDIVLDRSGPMVLEVNKRPGLEIQNTNLEGLLKRLRFIEERLPDVQFLPVSRKVAMAQDWDRRGWA